jgi:hypothetical protein
VKKSYKIDIDKGMSTNKIKIFINSNKFLSNESEIKVREGLNSLESFELTEEMVDKMLTTLTEIKQEMAISNSTLTKAMNEN